MKLILIIGSWGSGTTAVIGALDALGLPKLGAYFQSSDPKTPNTFELMSFRKLIHQYVNESSLKPKENYQRDFIPALKEYKKILESQLEKHRSETIALKMPLASLCVPEIRQVFETKIIFVHRNLNEIEASRRRRKWSSLYGALGAKHIYHKIFNDTLQHNLSFLSLSYHDIVNNKSESLIQIIRYCEIEHLQNNLENAEKFIRSKPKI